MKNLLLFVFILLSTISTFAQSTYQKGVVRGNNNDNTTITRMEFDNYGYHVMFGKFYDSVHVEPFSQSITLLGGSSSTGVHNAFYSVYDAGGFYMFAHKLGNTTDSVTITSAALDNMGNVLIGGSFKGTVDFADNIGSPFYLSSLGTESNGFIAMYDYNGVFINAYVLENSTGISQVNDVSFDGPGNIVVIGQFTGTVDLDPSGSNVDLAATGIDGFIATYGNSMSGYYSSVALDGLGNQIPTFLINDWANIIVGGVFENQIDMDLSVGTNLFSSNGGKDIFMFFSDDLYNVSTYITLGGTGHDKLKDLLFSPSQGYYALIDFQNTVNFDPEFGTTNLTSNGQSDVAVARYFNNFQLGYVKQFGNANNDNGYRISKNEGTGGRSQYPDDDFLFTMSYSGTVDFNPEPTETANSTSSNTSINSAVINLDSSGVYLFHGSIEAKSITGYKTAGFDGNDIIMAGNFAGTDVDMLVYADTSSLSHAGVNSGFYVTYNRCQMVVSEPYIVEPYECGTCNAKMTIDIISGGVQPIEYQWSNGDYYEYSEVATGACPDNENYYNINVTDHYGCYAGDTLWIRNHDTIAQLDLSLNLIQTSCGNNFGSAEATAINNIGSVSYYYSTGNTTSLDDSLEVGNYFVQVIDDSLMCYATKNFFIENSNGPIITVNSSIEPACGGVNDGSIDVTVTGGAAPYTFLWTNGETTEDISNLSGGTYTLTVTDASGCENSECVTLYQPNELDAYLWTSYPSNCLGADGYLIVEAYDGMGPYSYQWDAAAGSSTLDSAGGLASGIYTVTVTDASGCSKNFDYAVSDFGGPWGYINWSNNPDCLGNDGYIDLYVWDPGTGLTYEWTNGEITEDITVEEGGVYDCLVTDVASQCKSVFSAWIYPVLPATPTICMVTVDSTATKNVVVWDKSTTQEANYYNIYREGFCNSNDFGIVGVVDFDSLSVFYDTVVNSDTRTWRYYVTAVDTCGQESAPSDIHRTIHLTSQFDSNYDIALDWSDYVGMQILGYKIYRKQPSGNLFDFVDSVGAFTTNYLDTASFSAYTEVEYFVDAIPASVCNASRAYNQNEARSNHSKSAVPPNMTLVSPEFPITETSFELYPNPSNDMVNLKVISQNKNWKLQMMDQTGRVIISGNIQDHATFSTKDISSGVYFIRMTSDTNEIHTMKLMIVH